MAEREDLTGKKAPNFNLPDQDGNQHKLADYKGKKVVLYFYPKDDTPGCTKEACGFRDLKGEFDAADTVIFGVSKDGDKSHQKFIGKYKLNFPLLSDENLKVHEAYGAYGEKNMYGIKRMGVIRSTVLIGPDGKVAKHWRSVKVAGHMDKVLEAAKAI